MEENKTGSRRTVTIDYSDAAAFLEEQKANLDFCGLFFKDCDAVPQFENIDLVISFAESEQRITVDCCQVIWSSDVLPGQNTCDISIRLDQKQVDHLMGELQPERAPKSSDSRSDELCVQIELTTSDRQQVTISPGNEAQLHQVFERLPHAEQIKIALKGNFNARQILLRKASVPVIRYLLQNPKISEVEIAAIAALPVMSPEILESITRNKDWMKVPAIRLNIIKNINTPVPIACRFVPFLHERELRQLLKAQMLSQGVAAAVRRKLYKTG